MAAIFANVRREVSALHPSVGRSSVEVQFDCLRWRADTDFGDVQCIVFDVFDLHLVRTLKLHVT